MVTIPNTSDQAITESLFSLKTFLLLGLSTLFSDYYFNLTALCLYLYNLDATDDRCSIVSVSLYLYMTKDLLISKPLKLYL